MKKLFTVAAILLCAVLLHAQSTEINKANLLDEQPQFVRSDKNGPCDVDLSRKLWKVDFRSCDFSGKDLTTLDEKSVMRYIDFDDKTIWPKGDKMPKWLAPQKIMQIGKTPGLNVKKLHQQGITGKGVGLVIIDQNLPKHAEYQDKLLFYKDKTSDIADGIGGSMHGAAVASIAVGKNIGVAPEADLYYVNAIFSETDKRFDSGPIAEAIKEILKINKTLPLEKKIAVISISRGFGDSDNGRQDFLDMLEEAKKQNVAVFTTNNIFTLSRAGYLAEVNKISSYTQIAGWCKLPHECDSIYASTVCVPTDYRITASPTGFNDYVAYGEGGLSWGVPYYAGLYALAKQVYSALDAETFEAAAKATAGNVKAKGIKGEEVDVKYFINPTVLIEYFQKKSAEGQEGKEDKRLADVKKALNKADGKPLKGKIQNKLQSFETSLP